MSARPTIAVRISDAAAREHFENGGIVLVNERGHEPEIVVTRSTTTHDKGRISWDELARMVDMWRNRYPNQRFYACTLRVAR